MNKLWHRADEMPKREQEQVLAAYKDSQGNITYLTNRAYAMRSTYPAAHMELYGWLYISDTLQEDGNENIARIL